MKINNVWQDTILKMGDYTDDGVKKIENINEIISKISDILSKGEIEKLENAIMCGLLGEVSEILHLYSK